MSRYGVAKGGTTCFQNEYFSNTRGLYSRRLGGGRMNIIVKCENCGKEYNEDEMYEVDLDTYSYMCECGYENLYFTWK